MQTPRRLNFWHIQGLRAYHQKEPNPIPDFRQHAQELARHVADFIEFYRPALEALCPVIYLTTRQVLYIMY